MKPTEFVLEQKRILEAAEAEASKILGLAEKIKGASEKQKKELEAEVQQSYDAVQNLNKKADALDLEMLINRAHEQTAALAEIQNEIKEDPSKRAALIGKSNNLTMGLLKTRKLVEGLKE